MEPAEDRDAAVAHFVALTDCPTDKALEVLEGADWNVELAVQLFYTEGEQPAAPHAGASEPALDAGDTAFEGGAALDDDGVRRPDAAVTERLYDGGGGHPAAMLRYAPARRPASQDVQFASFREGGGDAPGLDSLYRPPDDIIATGSLDECEPAPVGQSGSGARQRSTKCAVKRACKSAVTPI